MTLKTLKIKVSLKVDNKVKSYPFEIIYATVYVPLVVKGLKVPIIVHPENLTK